MTYCSKGNFLSVRFLMELERFVTSSATKHNYTVSDLGIRAFLSRLNERNKPRPRRSTFQKSEIVFISLAKMTPRKERSKAMLMKMKL